MNMDRGANFNLQLKTGRPLAKLFHAVKHNLAILRMVMTGMSGL
jgi:hypothetical protein